MAENGYAVAGPDIVFENFNGDLVVLNIATGRYFGFNPTAARVWEALMYGVRPATLVAAGVEPSALAAFLERLVQHELVTPTACGETTLSSQIRDALATDRSAPTVDVYEDLADLIVADPIHDTAADQGWPHVAKAA
jgi:hypothetical protein